MHRTPTALLILLAALTGLATACKTPEDTTTTATHASTDNANTVKETPTGMRIAPCTGAEKRDDLFIKSATIDGDTLRLDVGAGGGCAEHTFGLCWKEGFAESKPPRVGVIVTHDAHGDTCEAIISQHLDVDLTPLKRTYLAAYPNTPGRLSLDLPGRAVLYTPAP